MPISIAELDMDRVKRGEYTTSELLQGAAPPQSMESLGNLDGHLVFLKNGRYGKYLEWNGQKCSAKTGVSTLEAAEALLKHRSPPDGGLSSSPGVLRVVNSDCSIRQGKYGQYVYYKTSEMKSPMFFAVKQFKWQTAKEEEILQWIRDQKKK
jgi:topoisomerase IA-like protein